MAKIRIQRTKQTVLVIMAGFTVVYFFTAGYWSLYVAAGIGIPGLLSNYLATKIDFLWMKLGWLLGQMVSPVGLSVIYYLVLFPIALLARLFGKRDPLQLKNNSDDLFKTSNRVFDKQFFEKPW